MATFQYPTQTELLQVAQTKMPRLTEDRPIFKLFPMRSVQGWQVTWEQLDNYTGLQAVRGLNGDPPRVKRTGAKRYTAQPFAYGEFERIDEEELTTRRTLGTFNTPASISDLVMMAQDKLMGRM